MPISSKDLFLVKSLGFNWSFRRRYTGGYRAKRIKIGG